MNEKQNKRLMHLIRRVHGLMENEDIQKQRTVQNQIGSIFDNSKNNKFKKKIYHHNNKQNTEIKKIIIQTK